MLTLFTRPILMAVIRHGIGTLGAVIVAAGWADAAATDQAINAANTIVGAAGVLGAFGWSIADKVLRK